jgi:hypothetical protein
MKTHSIEIAIRTGHDHAPRVRFERSTAIPAGTISMLVVGGDLVVSSGTRAVVDAVGSTVLDGAQGTVPELLLRDGNLELAVCCRAREPSALAASSEDALTKSDGMVHGALAIRDAEWTPADESEPSSAPRLSKSPRPAPEPRVIPLVVAPVQREPATAAAAAWDAPTRFHPVAEPMPQRPSPVAASGPVEPKAPASPPGAPSPRRMMIRRVALLSMLLCTFVLMMRTRRAREARTAATASSHVAATPTPSTTRGASPAPERQTVPIPPAQTAPLAQAAETPSTSPSTPLPPEGVAAAASSRKPSAVTPARRAADALANGAYADALPMYETLGAEAGPNAPAYQQTARILRARLQQDGVAPR